MKIVPSLLLLLFVSSGAYAQTAQIDRIQPSSGDRIIHRQDSGESYK